MYKSLLKSICIFLIGGTFLYGNASKIESHKKQLDQTLLKIENIAKEGKVKKFPSICAKTDTRVVKYVYKDAPKEIYDYYDHAKNVCRGKLHLLSLQEHLKQEGESVCKKMEVKLQINHIKSFLTKTDDIAIWDKFMLEYKKTCPNNLNF